MNRVCEVDSLECRSGLGIQDLEVFSVLRALHSHLMECFPRSSQEIVLKHISDYVNILASNSAKCKVHLGKNHHKLPLLASLFFISISLWILEVKLRFRAELTH